MPDDRVPQATLRRIRSVVDASARGAVTGGALEKKTGLSSRHVSYAVSAACALELLERNGDGLSVTPLGHRLAQTAIGSEQEARVLFAAIDESQLLRNLAPGLMGAAPPTVEEIAGRITKLGKLGPGTAVHRAAMIAKWRDDLVNRRIDFKPVARAKKESMAVIEVRNFAQIRKARVEFGDLTVLVGPQATGKSLVLQWFKWSQDADEIITALRQAGQDVTTTKNLIELIFGGGMDAAWSDHSSVTYDSNPVSPAAMRRRVRARDHGKVFFIPAHRALLLSEGWPAPFIKLNTDTPVVARLFSQNLYQRFSGRQAAALFPVGRLLKEQYRAHIDQAIFHGGSVELEKEGLRYQLRLTYKMGGEQGGAHLPFMTWTAGQREFTPLLLGLYHVLPPRNTKKLKGVDWVVVEEPEMGLHPQAITVFMLLVLDLLWRGYRVVVSTHSPLILDIVWAIRQLAETEARWQLLSQAFDIRQPRTVQAVMEHALRCDYRVFYFSYKEGRVESEDISTLDPSSLDTAEAEWGGLTTFSSRFSEAVRTAVNESERVGAE